MQIGADHGPFLLARQGLYARENDVRCFHLLFKGNDVHSGSSPTLPPLTDQLRAEVDSLYSLGPQNRVVYVSYPSTVGSSRSASFSVSPPLGFGNLGAVAPHKESTRHFTDSDVSFLGTDADRAQRFGVELALMIHNAIIEYRLSSDIDIEDILKSLYSHDKDGQKRYLAGFERFHPQRDVQEIEKWLGYWRWYENEAGRYLIHITKGQLRAHRSTSACTNISPALLGHQQALAAEPEDRPDGASTIVETVLGLFLTSTGVEGFLPESHGVLRTFAEVVDGRIR